MRQSNNQGLVRQTYPQLAFQRPDDKLRFVSLTRRQQLLDDPDLLRLRLIRQLRDSRQRLEETHGIPAGFGDICKILEHPRDCQRLWLEHRRLVIPGQLP